MAYEKKDLSGALFKNDRKEKETHPDYKGDCLIAGKAMWISAWLNESKSGTKYMSLAFKEKEQANAPAPAASSSEKVEDFSDDIPFNQVAA